MADADLFSKKQPAARTEIFAHLRKLFNIASLAEEKNGSVQEILETYEKSRWTRRRFLQASAAAAAAVYGSQFLAACRYAARPSGRSGPRIVIVGAGLAGLNAAHHLSKAGFRAEIYEGARRTGGRLHTAENLLAPGLTTELGGEFIDSSHADMFALVKEFNLPLIDVESPGEEKLRREAFFFGGKHVTEAEAIEAFRPFIKRMKADKEKISDMASPDAAALDKTPLSTYLDDVCGRGPLRDLLDTAFVTEYGLECGEQSAVNMLIMISTDVSRGRLDILGDSDERFKVRGGNQRVVNELAARLKGRIRLEHRLESLRSRGDGFRLTFQKPGGVLDVDADVVILTAPFSVLREMDLRVDLPPAKKRAIAELGYGTNAKILAGFQRRIWRDRGYAGNVYTDEGFQLGWDNSRLQGGTSGGFTYFLGGKIGAASGAETAAALVDRFNAMADKIFPGLAKNFNGQAHRIHWPTLPLIKGSYSCYKPGQWTSIAGTEGEPVGNLYFAGEHCGGDFAGFMNGAAFSGRKTAEAILAKIGAEPTPAH